MLGRYLGPEIDVRPEMTANIMKVNGKVMHHLTYCGLKEDDNYNLYNISLKDEFDISIIDRYELKNLQTTS